MNVHYIMLTEHGKFDRSCVDKNSLVKLQRLDEKEAIDTGDTVLDWGHLKFVRAKSYVGVIQAGDIQVEVLPKIDNLADVSGQSTEFSTGKVRGNFLYMLGIARKLPLHERDLASQSCKKLPILDSLIRIFGSHLLLQLRRGQVHEYLTREEDLSYVRGRILIQQQITKNLNQKHRIHARFQEFSNDCLLNQVFRESCIKLSTLAVTHQSQQFLRECLFELGDVEPRTVSLADFEQVHLRRDSERFRYLLDFCRLLFRNSSPSLHSGSRAAFSLMFPMERLFEEFVGEFIRRNATSFGLTRSDICTHAKSATKWLVNEASGKGRFLLKPDVIIWGNGNEPKVILDTKWKRLQSDADDAKNGVQQSDMYQLYAYATRYACNNNVLLYPKVNGASEKVYSIDGDCSKRLRIAFLDLGFDLSRYKSKLIEQLKGALSIS